MAARLMEEERLGLMTGILGGSNVAESELAKGYVSCCKASS